MTASTGNPLRKIYDWTLSLSKKKSASAWLAGISFAEASFFPIPPDVLLIPLCLGALKKALRFAFICSVASVLGGLAGYAIGAIGWESLQASFYAYVPGFTEAKFEKITQWYAEWGWPPSLFGRIFPDSIQDIYHRKRSSGNELASISAGIRCQSFRSFFSGCSFDI